MNALRMKAGLVQRADARAWWHAALFAVPAVAFLLALYYHWFAVRDRHLIFLYFHDMGAERFDTTPFGWVTVGRYWMTGFVAGGAVMVLYGTANLIAGRVRKSYHAPEWWRLWLLCAIPLVIGVPAIVMTVNDPVLPLRNAAQVTVALLIALALAVWFGELAARQPSTYLLLLVDGVALTGLYFVTSGIDDLLEGRTGRAAPYLIVALFGLVLLAIGSAITSWRRQLRIPSTSVLFMGYASVQYLLVPLIHHLFFSYDEGTYIPSADNYFIFVHSVPGQLLMWGIMLALALGVTRLRVWLRKLRGPEPAA